MSGTNLKTTMLSGALMTGTFLKTPAFQLVEILARSKMDFVALDAEHSPFDRAAIDSCIAIARALEFPVLVRVPEGSDAQLLMMLDAGANAVIVPHVNSVEKARAIAKAAHFGHGGRGFAGSTRWAGYATKPMADVLKMDKDETVVIAQIEEPEGVEAIDAIAAVDGIDAVFVGPADLAVCYGVTDIAHPKVMKAMETVAAAAKKHGKCMVTFASNASAAAALKAIGVTMFFIASEHAFVIDGANRASDAFQSA
jgi:2-keto-3-deoxy-L-rhamnonate aldolase RhmA